MPTRNMVLTDHQSELIERLVSLGRYQNASEVLREGLRLVEDHAAEERIRLKALGEAVRTGIADADAGRLVSFDTEAGLEQYLTALADEVFAEGCPAPGK